MSSNIHIPVAGRNAALDAELDRADAGSGAATISFYAGTIPDPDTAITTQTLLGTCTCSDPAWAAATGGVKTANAITDDSSADANGTPTFARMRDSSGNTVADFTAGVAGSGAALILVSSTIVQGQPIQIVSLSVTMPSGA